MVSVTCVHAAHSPRLGHGVAILLTKWVVLLSQCCIPVALIFLNDDAKQGGDGGNARVPRRSCDVFPLREKVCAYRENVFI